MVEFSGPLLSDTHMRISIWSLVPASPSIFRWP